MEKSPDHAVIDCNGVGYYISISSNTFAQLKDEELCKLLVHYAVSVDVRSGASSHQLFGFAKEEERILFKHLIKISGVSSTMAGVILSGMDPNAVMSAVANKDAKAFQTIKGVGPKLAQRIVMELSGKLDMKVAVENNLAPQGNTIRNEAFSALCSLGFDKNRVENVLQTVISKTNHNGSVEELIKESLKVL